jgi:hypothetical protein
MSRRNPPNAHDKIIRLDFGGFRPDFIGDFTHPTELTILATNVKQIHNEIKNERT